MVIGSKLHRSHYTSRFGFSLNTVLKK